MYVYTCVYDYLSRQVCVFKRNEHCKRAFILTNRPKLANCNGKKINRHRMNCTIHCLFFGRNIREMIMVLPPHERCNENDISKQTQNCYLNSNMCAFCHIHIIEMTFRMLFAVRRVHTFQNRASGLCRAIGLITRRSHFSMSFF